MLRCPECSCPDSFNDDGYCRECGHHNHTEPRIVEPFHLNGNWPTNTWFQRRRLEVAKYELTKLSKVQS